MTRIIDYKIVDCFYTEQLKRSVIELIQDGYQPFGNLCIINSPGNRFIQVMVKYENYIEDKLGSNNAVGPFANHS